MTQIELPLRSVSQVNSYCRCPQAYKLARIDKVWSRPAAWLPQGSAVHGVLELVMIWESYGMPLTLEEAKEIFKELYSKEVSEYTEETPNFDWWFHSGPYNGERDVERRWEVGLEQVEKFYAWRESNEHEIWITPDGTPAIELYFEIELNGILVRGYIDAVVVVDGELVVRDYKTGAKPGDDFQLAVYAIALWLMYGVVAKKGDYYMAGKKGMKPKLIPFDLTGWTLESVTEKFHEVEAGIQAGEFEPDPSPDKCGFCDVNLSCPLFQ